MARNPENQHLERGRITLAILKTWDGGRTVALADVMAAIWPVNEEWGDDGVPRQPTARVDGEPIGQYDRQYGPDPEPGG